MRGWTNYTDSINDTHITQHFRNLLGGTATNSGIASNIGGGNTQQNLLPSPVWRWMFDSATSSPVFLSSEVYGGLTVTGTLSTVRIELYNLIVPADTGAAQGIVQVTSVVSGASPYPATARSLQLAAYSNNAATGAHNAGFWSMSILASLTGGGYGSNTIMFPALTPGTAYDLKFTFAAPSAWQAWSAPAGSANYTPLTIIQVTSNSMAQVCDGAQIVNVGCPVVNNSGVAARLASLNFLGSLARVHVYCENGTGHTVLGAGYPTPPTITTKQSPPFNVFLYDAAQVRIGTGFVEHFCPNGFPIGTKPQQLNYGINNDSQTVYNVSQPARMLG